MLALMLEEQAELFHLLLAKDWHDDNPELNP
jgi:hypothetical protein